MKFFATLILILPLSALCQQIQTNKVDGFTGQRIVETSVVSLKTAYTKGMGIYLSLQGQHYLVNIVGYGTGFGAIKKTDILYLLMEDGLVITAQSIGNQPANEEGPSRVYQHHYLMREKDVKDLSTKKTVLIRLTTVSGNRDITLSKRNTKEIQKMAAIFIKELNTGGPSRKG